MSSPRIGSLCSGYGGLDMAVQEVFPDAELAWVADNDPGAAAILAHHHPDVPNLGDITKTDWSTVEPVDILALGTPCQDISNAGKREGIKKGNRSGLWFHAEDAIEYLRPRLVVFENVAALRTRGLDIVLEGLARLGFDAEWACVRADEVGAPHQRKRFFVLAVAQDTDRSALGEWWTPAPGQEEGRRARPDAGGRGGLSSPESYDWRTRPEYFPWSYGADFGPYAPAIRRWEQALGVPAPAPKEPSPRGGERLAAAFAEWMMGIPGRVTRVPGLSRNAQLKAIGNGVCPQQGAYGLRELLPALLRKGTSS